MPTIKIVPEDLRAAASFIGDKRDSILGELQALKSKIDEIEPNFEGSAKAEFFNSFTEMYNNTLTKTFPEVLEGIATQLTSVAEIMENADTEVAKALKGN